MILLVPISRFRVDYEVGAGKPFSRLDLLLTRALAEQPLRLEELRRTFRLPARLIIEMLVNLFHEGWLTMTEAGFEVTARGRAGISGEIRPESHRVWTSHAAIIVERLTGGLIPAQEIVYETEANLQKRGLWDDLDGYRLSAEYTDDQLDEGQVKVLLRRANGEWVRSVARPRQETKGWNWLPVDADPETGSVVGLPERWRLRLRDRLLDDARHRPAQSVRKTFWLPHWKPRALEADKVSGASLVELSIDNLLEGSPAHKACLSRALATACNSVLIASSVMGPLSPELREEFKAAIARGITIDLLWGHTAEQPGPVTYPALASYATLARDLSTTPTEGALRFNERPAPSNLDLLVFDTVEGYRAVVGCCPWLEGPRHGEAPVSVEFADAALISEICLSVASVMARCRVHHTSGGLERWRHIASELDQQAATALASAEDVETVELSRDGISLMRIVHNQDHAARMTELVRTSQYRLGLLCGDVDRAAFRRLEDLSRRQPRLELPPRILGGKCSLQPEEVTKLNAELERSGTTIRFVPGLAASALVADATVLVGGYPFLSRGTDGETALTDLGLQIDGGPLPDRLWEVFTRLHSKEVGQ
jgi:hypothetical protein